MINLSLVDQTLLKSKLPKTLSIPNVRNQHESKISFFLQKDQEFLAFQTNYQIPFKDSSHIQIPLTGRENEI